MKPIIFLLILISVAVGQTGVRKDRQLLVDFRNDNNSALSRSLRQLNARCCPNSFGDT